MICALAGLCATTASVSRAAGELVATLPGEISVDNKGAANYSVPLAVPSGRSGLQPKLALNYSSQAGNGSLGFGFSLSTGYPQAITRGRSILARDGVVRGVAYDDQDKFYLDGKRLVLTSGTYGYAGSTYRTEIESFVEVLAFGTSDVIDGFRLTAKDGSIICFGKNVKDLSNQIVYPSPDAYHIKSGEIGGKAATWAVKWVEDLIGNYVEFKYNETDFNGDAVSDFVLGSGEHVLTSIHYTGNRKRSIAPAFKVWLRYNDPSNSSAIPAGQGRSDGAVAYAAGRSTFEGVRLDRVSLFAADSNLTAAPRQAYVFKYASDTASGTLRLSELFLEDNSSGTKTTPSTVFTWGSQSLRYHAPQAFGNGSYKVAERARGDFNGDGRVDLLLLGPPLSANTRTGLIAYSSSFGSLTPVQLPFAPISGTTTAQNSLVSGDFNGDGRTDLAWAELGTGPQGGGWYMSVSGDSGFGVPQRIVPELADTTYQSLTEIPGQAVDLDGDGLDELLIQKLNKTVTLELGDIGWSEIDWDDDGNAILSNWRDDWDAVTGYAGGVGMTTSMAMPGSPLVAVSPKFSGSTLTFTQHEISNPINSAIVGLIATDVDGDGKSDFFAVAKEISLGNPYNGEYKGAIAQDMWVIRNLGNWTLAAEPKLLHSEFDSWHGGFGHLQGDVNGDGLDDLLVLKFNIDRNGPSLIYTGKWDIGLSKGNGSFDFESFADLPAEISVNGVATRTFKQRVPDVQIDMIPEGDGGTFYPSPRWVRGSEINTVQLIDVNGDGRKDFVWHAGAASWRYLLSKGASFDTSNPPRLTSDEFDPVDYIHQYNWEEYGYGAEISAIDSDGNGKSDLAIIANDALYYACAPATDLFRLVSVEDGLGRTTDLAYGVTTDAGVYTPGVPVSYPIREVRSPQRVVVGLWKDSASANASDRAHFAYQYSGSRLDLAGRGPLGFHSFVTLDTQTNLFKYQFLAQSFPMTGLTARELTCRYWLDGANVRFRYLNAHDNTVVFDEVVKSASDSTAWGTVYPFMSKAVESRWEDGPSDHFWFGAAGSASSKSEELFKKERPGGAHITVTAESLFDSQTTPQLAAPAGYNASDRSTDWASAGVNVVTGVSAPVAINGPKKIYYGNLRKLSTDFSDGFTESVVTEYLAPTTNGLTGLVDNVATTVSSTGFGTEAAPIKRYTYWTAPGNVPTSLVATETIDSTDDRLDLTTTYVRDPVNLGRITETKVSGYGSRSDQILGSLVSDEEAMKIGSEISTSLVTSFDSKWDLPTSSDNTAPYRHTTTTTYHAWLGLPTVVTDAENSASATTTYDGLGRKTKVRDDLKELDTNTEFAWTSDTATDWTRGDTVTVPTEIAGALTLKPKYAIRTTASVQPPVTAYYDRLGRVIRTVKEGYANQKTVTDTLYNSLGQVVAASLPYLEGTTRLWSQTSYDALGRIVSTTAPNGTVTTNAYRGRITQVTVDARVSSGTPTDAAKLQTNSTLVDAKGRTIKVWNADNLPVLSNISGSDQAAATSTTASIEYVLDGFGRMRTTILKDQTQTITATYDAHGRQTSLNDPDKGLWSYLNNALGHVVRQTDARGNVTRSTFDRLGRSLTRRTEEPSSGPVETANWYYYDNNASADLHLAPIAVGTNSYEQRGWVGAAQREHSITTGAAGYADPGTATIHYYDAKGRPSLNLSNVDQKWFYTFTEYDQWSRLSANRYYWRPAGLESPGVSSYTWKDWGYTYTYDGIGSSSKSYLIKVSDSATPEPRIWWEAASSTGYDHLDRPVKVRKGSGHWTERTYRAADGTLASIKTGPSLGSNVIQNLAFEFDGLGNLTKRESKPGGSGPSESFLYDNLNRLTNSSITGAITYAPNGNILSKLDVSGNPSGTYTYAGTKPHAVTNAFGFSMTYDASGNLSTRSGNGQTWATRWAGFDKPRWLARDKAGVDFASDTTGSEFLYNTNRSRVIHLEFDQLIGGASGAPSHYTSKKLYAMGPDMEADFRNNVDSGWMLDRVRIYVPGPEGNVGSMEFGPTASFSHPERALVYHYDHLGSVESITPYGATSSSLATDNAGNEGRYSEDAWGARRNAVTWSGGLSSSSIDMRSLSPRGFTGHEMLDGLGFIHMNGRIYDALLGRFISADILVQFPRLEQSFNRYAYAQNRPLTWIDESGFAVEAPPQAPTVQPQPVPGVTPPSGSTYTAPRSGQPAPRGPMFKPSIASKVARLQRNQLKRDIISAVIVTWTIHELKKEIDECSRRGDFNANGVPDFIEGPVYARPHIPLKRLESAEIDPKKVNPSEKSPSALDAENSGGTYTLTDPDTGEVVRTGRTNDLGRRESEHKDDEDLQHLDFNVDVETDDYAEQRGREQVLHDAHPGARNTEHPEGGTDKGYNKRRPISPTNRNRQKYLDAEEERAKRAADERAKEKEKVPEKK